MPDGSVVLVEMFGPRLTRVQPGRIDARRVAEIPAARTAPRSGPTARSTLQQRRLLHAGRARRACCSPVRSTRDATSAGGSSASTPHTGAVTDLYTECDGRPLRAPNDLVMDGHGGFWFTDHGIRDTHGARTSDLTASTTPAATGRRSARSSTRSRRRTASACRPTATTLYWAETHTGRVFQSARSSAPASSRRRCRSTRRSCCTGCPGCSSSTRSPSTARAGSAWRR